jgi:hypothetical protein
LEKRQTVKLIILIVQHSEARHARMIAKPGQDFVAARLLWKIGRDVDERDALVPSAEKTAGIRNAKSTLARSVPLSARTPH